MSDPLEENADTLKVSCARALPLKIAVLEPTLIVPSIVPLAKNWLISL